MYFIYLTAVVCLTGVLNARVGADLTNTGGNGNVFSGPTNPVGEDQETEQEPKSRFLDIITNVVGEIEEGNHPGLHRETFSPDGRALTKTYKYSIVPKPIWAGPKWPVPGKQQFLNSVSRYIKALEQRDVAQYWPSYSELVERLNALHANRDAGLPAEDELNRPLVLDGPIRKERSENPCDFADCWSVAQIFQGGDPICSGALLKPWIVLTAADCVRGKTPGEIYAVVTTTDKFPPYNVKVQVKEINIHPQSIQGNPDYNMAILIIYAHREWEVSHFNLPEHNYMPSKIIEGNLPLYATLWIPNDLFEYGTLTEIASVTRDYSLCGALSIIDESTWYCVYRTDESHVYNLVDVGSPIFLVDGQKRYCLGIYTGLQLQNGSPGHLYQSLNPSIDWIRDQVHHHSVPPA